MAHRGGGRGTALVLARATNKQQATVMCVCVWTCVCIVSGRDHHQHNHHHHHHWQHHHRGGHTPVCISNWGSSGQSPEPGSCVRRSPQFSGCADRFPESLCHGHDHNDRPLPFIFSHLRHLHIFRVYAVAFPQDI